MYYTNQICINPGLNKTTVLPPNSRFLGPEFFREFEIRELKIYNFPPNHYRIVRKNRELGEVYLMIP